MNASQIRALTRRGYTGRRAPGLKAGGNPLGRGRNSKLFPLFSRDSCLAQQLRQESGADVAAVRVRDGKSKAVS